MTPRLVLLHVRAMTRSRDVLLVVGAGLALTFVGNLFPGAQFATRGMLGTWVFDADGVLTYGLAAALVGAGLGVAVSAVAQEPLHTRGIGRLDVLGVWLASGAIVGALVLPLVIVVQLASGLVDSLIRAGHPVFGSPVPIDWHAQGVGELRQLGCYALAGCLGAATAAALRSRPLVALALGFCVVLYLPFAESVLDRAHSALEVFALLPFGALRGIATGNGGLFGASESGLRLIDPSAAAALYCLWLVLALGAAVGRSWFPSRRRHVGLGAALAVGLGFAVLCGAVLPQALAGSVPWRWQPDWRRARDAGWDSPQVAARWAEAVRRGDAAGQRDVRAGAGPLLPRELAQPLREAASITVQPERELHDAFHVALTTKFDPPVRSGNVEVREAAYALTFTLRDGRYLVTHVEGPAVTNAVVRP